MSTRSKKNRTVNFTTFKGGVGNFGETSSSALEFENTQPEKNLPLPYRPAKMIGRAFYSATASTFFYVFIVKAFQIFIAIGMLREFHGI